MEHSARYVAFLRGINVGGHKQISMADLSDQFTKLGFVGVKTLLNTGNVIFETTKTNEAALTQKIETHLAQALGHQLIVLIRPMEEIVQTVKRDPFAKIKPDVVGHRYVTFVDHKSTMVAIASPKKEFEILEMDDRAVYSIAYPIPGAHFGNPTLPIEKAFGQRTTTRNWNTILKLAAL